LSPQTKAQFHKWDDEGLTGSETDRVNAQEASQLIGMMCERLRHVAGLNKHRIVDPKDLSEYDRTL
jgi:hypothetical protein